MKISKSGLMLSVAAAALFSTASLTAQAHHPMEKGVKCFGVNSCKGKGACRTAANSCKGKNSCSHKGFVFMKSEKQCQEHGGRTMAHHEKHGGKKMEHHEKHGEKY
jgi:uncharacterized membrane protein